MSTLLPPSLYATPVYLGNYGGSIQAVEFDSAAGRFGAVHAAADIENPSFLARSPDGRFLYSVTESKGGSLAAFSVAPDGTLSALNRQSSLGAGPCDIAVSPDGKFVAAANYGGGSVIVYRIKADGSLGEQAAFFQHTHASRAHANRQQQPHAHGVTWSPEGHLLLVPDLGGDRVYLYARDAATGAFTPNPAQAWLEFAPTAGPRHAVFSPDGLQLYVINELDNTLSVARYDASARSLTLIESVSTLPPGGYAGATKTAEVAVHPDGRTVYASNRGHDTLAVFSRDPTSGRLSPRAYVPVPAHPRHFAMSPDAHWLLVAGMDANQVQVFAISPTNGNLTPTAERIATPKPVCVRF